MALPIVMPSLAMAMKQGKVVEWKFNEGDRVETGQLLMIIETEKVTYDIESPGAGLLHILVELNDTIPVDEVVAYLAEDEEELAKLRAESPASVTARAADSGKAAAPASAAAPAVPARKGKVKISPAARKMAQKAGVDYTALTGTGPGGRIVKEDVQHAIDNPPAAPSAPVGAPPAAAEWDGETRDGKRVKNTMPLQGMRAAIAEHMMHSLHSSAQLTSTGEIDMTEAIRWRKSLVTKEEKLGVRVSYTDLIVYVLARVLSEQPIMNSSLIDNELILWEDVNIGVAVAIELSEFETGLIVPVVRNADKKTLAELSKEIKGITQRARTLTLEPADLGGGTFTITNFGVFGSGYTISTPVINQPEAAIIGSGSIVDMAVVRDGEIVVRPILPVSLTFDHRILDGAPIGKFMVRFAELMENPYLMF